MLMILLGLFGLVAVVTDIITCIVHLALRYIQEKLQRTGWLIAYNDLK